MILPKPTLEQETILNDNSRCKLVVAVPGSGKTTLLFQAIENIANSDCLLISFTKRTTEENLLKVERFFPLRTNNITVKTFDAFCHSVIVKNWEEAGYSKRPFFDQGFNDELFDDVYKKEARKLSVKSLDQDAIKKVIETSIRFQTTIKKAIKKLNYSGLLDHYNALKKIKTLYLKIRLEEGLFHYSEQVIQTYKLLLKSESVLDKIIKTYPIILIDEVQDLSPTQLKIAILLASKAQQTYFVGDDAQSIYGFRGVEGNNFNLLEGKIEHCKRFTLTQSFRCSIPIVNLASKIRSHIEDVTQIDMVSNKKGEKPSLIAFENEYSQYKYIASEIKRLKKEGVSYSDIAVISRLHTNITKLQRQLESQKIAVKTRYTEDSESFNIDDIFQAMISIFRLINNGFSEAIVYNVFCHLSIEGDKEHYEYICNEMESRNKQARKHQNKILQAFASCLIKATKAASLESKTSAVISFIIKYYKKHANALHQIAFVTSVNFSKNIKRYSIVNS